MTLFDVEAAIRLKDIDVTFHDFYYTDKDYRDMFMEAGLEIVKMHHPLGKEEVVMPGSQKPRYLPMLFM